MKAANRVQLWLFVLGGLCLYQVEPTPAQEFSGASSLPSDHLSAEARAGFIFAQQAPDIFSASRDVLYINSQFLYFVDAALLAPSSPSAPFTTSTTLFRTDPLVVPLPKDSSPLDSGIPNIFATPPDSKSEDISSRFRWGPAFGQSLLYTGIMHTFNIALQPGTRDALNGHWFTHYTQSVAALRGWSDSDTFMAPYVGHPIEGSIFGFIERQNDPRYRRVQWGDGREYWVSMLRSMAFGAFWHTQWKIGPASEDSIANVMLHASPGFITLVDTPTLGFCTMLAEDAADRYLIMGLENRTNNRAVIIRRAQLSQSRPHFRQYDGLPSSLGPRYPPESLRRKLRNPQATPGRLQERQRRETLPIREK